MGMKILSMPVDFGGCGFYRVRKPLDGLNRYTEADCHVIDYAKDDMKEIIKAIASADFIFMRPGAEVGMAKIKAIPELSKIKAKWIMDIDDNTDLISPYNEFYRSYGVKNYNHDKIEVWKDGVKGFSIRENQERVNSLKIGLRSADIVTTTTEKLAEHARKYNKNVYVNDNTIDTDHWWPLNNSFNYPLKVVWAGSPSHYADWYDIKEPLEKLMGEYNFEVIMLGSQYTGIFKKEYLPRVKALPWVPFEAHSYRMMALQGDIGIIPLANEPFNLYKSAIKHYENMAMGLPSVVSVTGPYKDSLIEGVTGLGYNTPDEFYQKMKMMLDDQALRSKISLKGNVWLNENKTLELESKKLYKYLSEQL